MQKIENIITFEEFRTSHDEALLRQREALENNAIAEQVLREGGTMGGWIPWDNGFVTAS